MEEKGLFGGCLEGFFGDIVALEFGIECSKPYIHKKKVKVSPKF